MATFSTTRKLTTGAHTSLIDFARFIPSIRTLGPARSCAQALSNKGTDKPGASERKYPSHLTVFTIAYYYTCGWGIDGNCIRAIDVLGTQHCW